MDVKKEILKRFTYVYFIFIGAIFVVVFYILYLVVFQRSYYESIQSAIDYHDIEGVRGDILDVNGRLLASSLTDYTISMDPLTEYLQADDTFYKYIDTLCLSLSHYFPEKTAQEYKNLIVGARNKGRRDVLLLENINYLQYLTVKKFPLFSKGRNRGGIKASKKEQIKLLHGDLCRRIIGFENTTNLFFGIEKKMNGVLEGTSGLEIAQNLGSGHFATIKMLKPPVKGLDVVTTIDINMQDIVDKALRKQLVDLEANFGVAVLIEVKTGEIRAIANLTRQDDSSYAETENKAITELYDPGSVMKIASVLVSFEKDNNLDTSQIINTEGGYWQVTKDFHIEDYANLGNLSIRQVIQKSSNIGTAKIVQMVFKDDPTEFIDRLSKLKLTSKLDLGLDDEPEPIVSEPGDDSWSGISFMQMAYGYEIMITPMHLITLYNAIANDGKMVKPKFVQQTQHLGKTVEVFPTEYYETNIATAQTIKYCQEMLEGVVKYGTGRTNVKSDLVEIAGKSGTAQIYKDGHYSRTDVNATFIGYFPADNPKYTCLVWINEPKKHKSGASAAGPVLKQIAEQIYTFDYDLHNKQFVVNNMDFSNSKPFVAKGFNGFTKKVLDIINISYSDNNTTWINPILQDDDLVLQPMYVKKQEMPDVKNMNARDAVFLLEKYKLNIKIYGAGKVVKQSIAPGTTVSENQIVELTLN